MVSVILWLKFQIRFMTSVAIRSSLCPRYQIKFRRRYAQACSLWLWVIACPISSLPLSCPNPCDDINAVSGIWIFLKECNLRRSTYKSSLGSVNPRAAAGSRNLGSIYEPAQLLLQIRDICRVTMPRWSAFHWPDIESCKPLWTGFLAPAPTAVASL